ncbi:MAG: Ger(x)C family spore germination C-terminal domain-containing protein [Oscillospiraceae bacterium]|nr:Ger(x)C family spore germination C-terminal domain-containing protein [Oscillospiraceae bacterium]
MIKDSAVEGFTSDDETAGVLLLGGWLRDTVELGGVTVELTDVKTDIDTENMMDIDINVEAKGTVVENSAGVRLSDTSGREVLERKMALTLLTQVKSAVTRGADMDADICGIARGIRLRHPVLTRDAEMNSVPSGASYNINIKATLVGTYDAEDAVLPVQGETEAAGEG